MFDEILGHSSVKEYLTRALSENRLPNTLLFSGLDGIGKRTLALHLSSELMKIPLSRILSGNAADFHFITPEGKSGLHSIDSLRKAIDLAHEAPFEAPAKIFLVEAIERMQPAAANALLKTLEEPHLDTYWILLTSSIREILPTILSRCAKIPFQPLTTPQVVQLLEQKGHPTHLAPFAHGSISKALELAQHPESEEARELLFSLLENAPHYPRLLQALELIEKLLETEEPLLKTRRADHLFTSIALYYRDQELRQIDPASSHLFFPKTPQRSTLPRWEEPLDQARLAFERNIKLSTCLESFFLSILPTH